MQEQQEQQQQQQRATRAGSSSSAVLAQVLPRWQALLLARLEAAQLLLPDVPLVSAAAAGGVTAVDDTSEGESCSSWQAVGCQADAVSTNNPGLANARLLCSADDLLEALNTVVPLPCKRQQELEGEQPPPPAQQATLLQAVRAPTRAWLQSYFAELQPDRRQVGLDDVLHQVFGQQQVQQARAAAASCSVAACRAVARSGVPASERAWVWGTALGLHAASPVDDSSSSSNVQQSAWWHPSPQDGQVLRVLCQAVDQQMLLVDVLTCADVQQVTESNAHFAGFGPAMRAVLLAFSRDASIAARAAVPPSPLVAAAARGSAGQQPRVYPPSGVLPFQGLAGLVAPLCCVYASSPAAILPVWRELYCRFFCRLHTLDAQPAPRAGLAVLCRTFMDLLQEVDPEVCARLGTLSGGSALDFALPWLVGGFAGQLLPNETLLLWDRIIGYDSLLPLPVLAVAVMTFRRDLVLAAESGEELLELLQDLSTLRVVPLLQALLADA